MTSIIKHETITNYHNDMQNQLTSIALLLHHNPTTPEKFYSPKAICTDQCG